MQKANFYLLKIKKIFLLIEFLSFFLKVSLILEDGEPGTPLAFSLETEKSPFGLPASGSLSLYQTSSFHGWDSLNVTIHVVMSVLLVHNAVQAQF